jgi:hypothetical protein
MRNRILDFSVSVRDQLQQYAKIAVERLLSLRIDARGSRFLCSLFSLIFPRARRRLRFRIHIMLESVLAALPLN